MALSEHDSGARRKDGIPASWYVIALVVYVTIGYFTKSVLLNWIMGPLFLLVMLYIIPTVIRGIVTKARTRLVE
ncbi:hypothetical protein EF847_10520 [Actinobacteria bacterium YIM 96077]|uniref:hypothetical protein n=1 Tax=Phytoactinopolyspora halophila TaxID=1981511 RepID=UPI000DD36D60|nr:hypothetical protein [Phytoactinopolyspora halophila]AYY13066.1 hypothetical protein EF847_10520 [Actinobacteria bacterium YIM 96077]